MDGTNRTAAFCVFGAMYNYTSSLRDILIELTKHIDVKCLDLIQILMFSNFNIICLLDSVSKNLKALVEICTLIGFNGKRDGGNEDILWLAYFENGITSYVRTSDCLSLMENK